jgi:transcriptional regulator with XRE-family HTH domain
VATDRQADRQRHLQQFGRRVRLLRQEAEYSQEQLAHEAGLHRTVVGAIERGERDIRLSTLWPLAESLGFDPPALLEPPPPKRVRSATRSSRQRS